MNVLVIIGYMCGTSETRCGLRLRLRHHKKKGEWGGRQWGLEDVTINVYDIKLVLKWFSQLIEFKIG